MTLLKIARMGHPVLRRKAEAVADPAAPEIQQLAAAMVATMADADGAGLAGPQIYQSKRIIVFHAPGERSDTDDGLATAPLTVLINPEIEILSDRMEEDWEGCLSIPGLRGKVPRHTHIRYAGMGPDGKPIEREASGFHARVVQHEVDHLDGVLYLDRMRDFDTLTFESEWVHHMKPTGKGDA